MADAIHEARVRDDSTVVSPTIGTMKCTAAGPLFFASLILWPTISQKHRLQDRLTMLTDTDWDTLVTRVKVSPFLGAADDRKRGVYADE